MTTATGHNRNALQVAENDAITREEYMRLSGHGSDEAAAEAELAEAHRRAAAAEGATNQPEPQERSPAPGRSCEHCGAPFVPSRRGRDVKRFCSPECRRRAEWDRRKATRAADMANDSDPAVSASTVVEVVGNGSSAAGLDAGAEPGSPVPSTGDGIAEMVGALLGIGTVGDVTLERDGWHLVVHPR